MATLNDILDIDLGLGDEVEKVASEHRELSEIEKLAADYGLTEETSQANIGLNKEARMSLDTIYSDMFPGDADIVGQDKTASQNEEVEMEKEAAAYEEAMGERAHDYFMHFVDAHITKMASEVADKMEHEIPGKLDDNEDESGAAMNTKGDMHIADKVMSITPPGEVGSFEHKSSPQGALKTAALRKHMLLLALGGENE